MPKKTLIEMVEPYDLKDVLLSLKKNRLIDSFKILSSLVKIETSYQKKFEISSFVVGDYETEGQIMPKKPSC